jgi:hypothetical protein
MATDWRRGALTAVVLALGCGGSQTGEAPPTELPAVTVADILDGPPSVATATRRR